MASCKCILYKLKHKSADLVLYGIELLGAGYINVQNMSLQQQHRPLLATRTLECIEHVGIALNMSLVECVRFCRT